MTNPLEPTILRMTVRTVTASKREHLLDVGTGKRSAIVDRIRAKIAAIEASLDSGSAITLENPTITYNGSHLESVEYDVTGISAIAAALREEMADARRTLGFGRPGTTIAERDSEA